MTSRLLDVEEL